MSKKTGKTEESGEQQAGFSHPVCERRDTGRRDWRVEKAEQSLAARLKNGDRSAAAELVDAYYEQIYLFMRRLGHSREASEDLTQESFFQAWSHIRQLRDDNALNGWLYRLAINTSKMYWRRHSSDKAVSIEEVGAAADGEVETDRIEHLEQLGLLNKAVVELPVKLRQAVVLHYMQQLTIAEAAEAAGVREGTFKSRLSRALKALRKMVT